MREAVSVPSSLVLKSRFPEREALAGLPDARGGGVIVLPRVLGRLCVVPPTRSSPGEVVPARQQLGSAFLS
jgi:hypothetical protein